MFALGLVLIALGVVFTLVAPGPFAWVLLIVGAVFVAVGVGSDYRRRPPP